MFGKNEIVGTKYFQNAEGKLLVTTIFFTLQGEGPFMGQPAVFVRLAKCNLACSFCDTYFDSGDWLSAEQLYQRIVNKVPEVYKTNKLARFDCGVVFTGGEPSLQNIDEVLNRLNHDFKWTQIESNGIKAINYPPRTVLVVSPKCREKDGVAVDYLKPNHDTLKRADCLKFVISAEHDSPYHEIPDWAMEWKTFTGLDIFVSPMNEYYDEPRAVRERAVKETMNMEERSIVNEVVSFWEPGLLNQKKNQLNHEWAAHYALNYNLRLNLQMHLYASLA